MNELNDEVRTRWKAFPIPSINVLSVKVAKENFVVATYEVTVLVDGDVQGSGVQGSFYKRVFKKESRTSTIET